MDSAAWDARYEGTELVWSAGPNQFVAEHCADLAPGRAVDLASGEGRNAIWLAQEGWRVTAVDFSAAGIDKGRRAAEQAGVDVDWVVADATTWQGHDFDLSVLAYLQLPTEQRRAAVRNAFAALAHGGTFLLVAHDSTNLVEGTGGPQDPAVLYTADEVLADLNGMADASYEVVVAERVARAVPASDEHRGEPERTAWDCLVRLTRR